MPTLQELRAQVEAEFATNHPTVVPTETVEVEVPPVVAPSAEPKVDEVPDPALPVAPVEEANKPAAGKRVVYTRTIDLGDGSGPQVFKAATKDELIDKLTEAQANATRKIREQNKKLKAFETKELEVAKPAREFKPAELTSDEQFTLSQELMTDPAGAIAKLLKSTVGATPEEIREALKDASLARQREAILAEANKFVAAHPEYERTAANETAMNQYLQKNNLAFTVKNLEIAFEDLTETGLVTVSTEGEVPPPAPIAPKKRVSVGISTRHSVATEVEDEEPKEPTVTDMMKLTPEERKRIVRAGLQRR